MLVDNSSPASVMTYFYNASLHCWGIGGEALKLLKLLLITMDDMNLVYNQ